MPMRLTVGTHYAGQTSWWLNGHNHSVVAWAGRTFDSMTDATQAANDFKTRSATAEFEVAMYWTGENAANTVVAHFRRRQPDRCRAACWQYFMDNVDCL